MGRGTIDTCRCWARSSLCQPVTPNSDDPFSFDAETKFNALPIGPSLDHVIARQLTRGATLLVSVGNSGHATHDGYLVRGGEHLYDAVGTPSEMFSSLTNLFGTGDAISPDTYQTVRGKSIIDVVKGDLATLQRFDMSQSDKNKLEAWKDCFARPRRWSLPRNVANR